MADHLIRTENEEIQKRLESDINYRNGRHVRIFAMNKSGIYRIAEEICEELSIFIKKPPYDSEVEIEMGVYRIRK